jgi:hypothetical protein
MFLPVRRLLIVLVALSVPCTAFLVSGCASSARSASDVTNSIPYEKVDRRQFTDAGVQVRTAHGNRVSVKVARNDTLVWFENEQTGRFTRAFLRRGNTIYLLARKGDYVRSSPSQTVAYRLFMEAWHKADQTGSTVSSSFADDQQ